MLQDEISKKGGQVDLNFRGIYTIWVYSSVSISNLEYSRKRGPMLLLGRWWIMKDNVAYILYLLFHNVTWRKVFLNRQILKTFLLNIIINIEAKTKESTCIQICLFLCNFLNNLLWHLLSRNSVLSLTQNVCNTEVNILYWYYFTIFY
jgi:hypothetical protein